jgi:chemotaxis protein MotB
MTLVILAGCVSQPPARQISGKVGTVPASSHATELVPPLSSIESLLKARLVSTDGIVSAQAGAIRITIVASALFRADTAELASGADGVLAPAAATLVAYPDTRIEVRAYTDDLDPGPGAIALTQLRAEAITTFFASHGIHSKRLLAHGEGAGVAIDGNSTLEQRRANRRVEIIISALSS